ncbi:F-box protein At3g56470-like [Apium graveolens]|uniref:F-box protein At3g56470-like n=1 Tax=Apium graveolens TaxID=4045 RepID=UPI003D7A32B3
MVPKMSVVFILSIPFFLETLHKLFYKKKKKEVGNSKEVGSSEMMNVWCELDTNLLGEIMDRLCFKDQARFRAVCKTWLAVRPITSTRLPWYFYVDCSLPTLTNRLQFRLYEPTSSNLVSLYNISLIKLGIPSPSSYRYLSVAIEHNWLFITCSGPIFSNLRRRYFILISLFTKKVFTLPVLISYSSFKFMIMSTTNPDSPNCVFFLVDAASNAHKIVVLSYRNGDKDWIFREFDRVVDFLPCNCRPVYIAGIMYIVSPYGQLASYDTVYGEFKFESLFVDELFRLNYTSSIYHRVFQLNGQLMLIYFGCRNISATSLGKQCIKMYDWSSKVWIPAITLGGNTLFVRDRFVEVTAVNIEDTSINGVLPNKLYWFFDGGCVIYSIVDGELVEFKSINSDDHDGGNLPEDKYNHDVSFSDAIKAVYWLYPPVSTTETI